MCMMIIPAMFILVLITPFKKPLILISKILLFVDHYLGWVLFLKADLIQIRDSRGNTSFEFNFVSRACSLSSARINYSTRIDWLVATRKCRIFLPIQSIFTGEKFLTLLFQFAAIKLLIGTAKIKAILPTKVRIISSAIIS